MCFIFTETSRKTSSYSESNWGVLLGISPDPSWNPKGCWVGIVNGKDGQHVAFLKQNSIPIICIYLNLPKFLYKVQDLVHTINCIWSNETLIFSSYLFPDPGETQGPKTGGWAWRCAELFSWNAGETEWKTSIFVDANVYWKGVVLIVVSIAYVSFHWRLPENILRSFCWVLCFFCSIQAHSDGSKSTFLWIFFHGSRSHQLWFKILGLFKDFQGKMIHFFPCRTFDVRG